MSTNKAVHVSASGPHGDTNTYVNRDCRCAPCTRAVRKYQYELRKRRLPLEDDDPRHGTRNAYVNWDCRCDVCSAANTVYNREARQRKRELTA